MEQDIEPKDAKQKLFAWIKPDDSRVHWESWNQIADGVGSHTFQIALFGDKGFGKREVLQNVKKAPPPHTSEWNSATLTKCVLPWTYQRKKHQRARRTPTWQQVLKTLLPSSSSSQEIVVDKITLWLMTETANNQQRFRSYFDGGLLCFDVANRTSFEELKKWYFLSREWY
eukprot:TRINITY_DN1831_c0_g1_i3.p1 TRINITY_DN1831_c0_g1~~TRINITY_DN1831_c0_g1_i3.p1  ORF type:complete len:171 (-),score=38.98 TRINITY_DN1831_c0_g1_i3:191-703(-)